MKNLTMKRFSNWDSATVKDQQKLTAALKELDGIDRRSDVYDQHREGV